MKRTAAPTIRAGVLRRLDGKTAEPTGRHALKPAYAETVTTSTGT
ncbi:hypothetical protein [Streptomyces sp. NPDC048638]